jgi:hypothetical protein
MSEKIPGRSVQSVGGRQPSAGWTGRVLEFDCVSRCRLGSCQLRGVEAEAGARGASTSVD